MNCVPHHARRSPATDRSALACLKGANSTKKLRAIKTLIASFLNLVLLSACAQTPVAPFDIAYSSDPCDAAAHKATEEARADWRGLIWTPLQPAMPLLIQSEHNSKLQEIELQREECHRQTESQRLARENEERAAKQASEDNSQDLQRGFNPISFETVQLVPRHSGFDSLATAG